MEIWALPMKYHRICCVTQGLCVPSPQNENYQLGTRLPERSLQTQPRLQLEVAMTNSR